MELGREKSVHAPGANTSNAVGLPRLQHGDALVKLLSDQIVQNTSKLLGTTAAVELIAQRIARVSQDVNLSSSTLDTLAREQERTSKTLLHLYELVNLNDLSLTNMEVSLSDILEVLTDSEKYIRVSDEQLATVLSLSTTDPPVPGSPIMSSGNSQKPTGSPPSLMDNNGGMDMMDMPL